MSNSSLAFAAMSSSPKMQRFSSRLQDNQTQFQTPPASEPSKPLLSNTESMMFLYFVPIMEFTFENFKLEDVPVNHQLVFPLQHLEANRY